jgi:protein-tyrosine phosphatase
VIDLHCHILPGVDDGALDLADSVAMATVAERDGISVVCATPHIRDDHDVRIDELADKVQELQRELDERDIAVRIAQGGELAQPAADTLSEEHLRAVSLDGGGWILLEPGPGAMADELSGVVERLAARTTGVIIAHPERHAGDDFEERLRSLCARGCLIQWTADFILNTDLSDPDAMMSRFVHKGLVHLLASDAHSSHGGRALRLRAAYEHLSGVCPPEQLRWIAETAPSAILRGEMLTAPW